MAKEKYLKKQNSPKIILFIIWCIAIYITAISASNFSINSLIENFKACNTKDGFLLSIAPILSLILTGIISSNLKAKLVFWRLNNTYPGHRVFSELILDDPRIDIANLKRKIGEFPEDPRDQNSKWYSLSRKMADKITVMEAHKGYLLSRDLCAISIIFAFIGPFGIYYVHRALAQPMFYFVIMLLQYFIFALVARNHGNRFACDVLAEYTAD